MGIRRLRSYPIFRRRADGRAASNLEERADEAAAVAVAMEEAPPGEMEAFDPMADAYFSSMNQYQVRTAISFPPSCLIPDSNPHVLIFHLITGIG